jgi:hypothetical protein
MLPLHRLSISILPFSRNLGNLITPEPHHTTITINTYYECLLWIVGVVFAAVLHVSHYMNGSEYPPSTFLGQHQSGIAREFNVGQNSEIKDVHIDTVMHDFEESAFKPTLYRAGAPTIALH